MILLDTNVAYWSLVADDNIGDSARRLMSVQRCYVSAISVLEFRIKAMKGKLHIPDGLLGRLTSFGFHSLPFTAEDAEVLPRFPSLVSLDPFDRMLLAQAQRNEMTFLTSDRILLDLEESWIKDARK